MGKIKYLYSMTIMFMMSALFILLCSSADAQTMNHQSPSTRLTSYGVYIHEIGDTVSIIIPSALLFPENAARLKSSSDMVLNDIVAYLVSFKKDLVYVDGFTDNIGSRERNIALSKQQALNVADYLWRMGIDARVQSSVGFGPDQPIATNETKEGRWKNRRIEINTRKIQD